jgi:hypothetical protein
MILYPNASKNTPKKLLDFINCFKKVSGYKTNLQKSVAFLYTNNKQTEKQLRKIIPLKIASKLLKKLNINLPYDPVIPYPKEFDSGYSRGTYTPMFLASLFTTAKLWKQPRCPTTDKWIKNM